MTETTPPRLAAALGTPLPILAGPFEGMEGVLVSVDPRTCTADLHVMLFGGWTLVQQPWEYVLDADERPVRPRKPGLPRGMRYLARIEEALGRLEEAGLYDFSYGARTFPHDLWVVENWVWARGHVDAAYVRLHHGIRVERVCGVWFLKLPMLFVREGLVDKATALSEQRAAPTVDKEAHPRPVEGAVYKGVPYDPRAFLRAASSPSQDALVHRFRRRDLVPVKIVFECLPYAPFMVVPLVPAVALQERVVRLREWGTIQDRVSVEDVLRESEEPAAAVPS